MQDFHLMSSGNPERAMDLLVRESFAMAELQAEALTALGRDTGKVGNRIQRAVARDRTGKTEQPGLVPEVE